MSKFGRRLVTVAMTVAMTGGLLAGVGAIPAQAAPAASISVSATTAAPRVKPYTYVLYGQGKYAVARIAARVTGASGATARVLAKRFGAMHFTPIGASVAITSSEQVVHFSVTPALATRYEVRVTTGSTVDVTSAALSVYVALAQNIVGVPGEKCTATQCTERIVTETLVPASAYKTEAAKRWYLYLGVNQSAGQPSTGEPKYLNRSTVSSASPARRMSATRYEVVFNFRAMVDQKNVVLFPNACTKDAEPADGIGLPGHHDCGNKKVPASAAYLG
jgi:hypothetical protein